MLIDLWIKLSVGYSYALRMKYVACAGIDLGKSSKLEDDFKSNALMWDSGADHALKYIDCV